MPARSLFVSGPLLALLTLAGCGRSPDPGPPLVRVGSKKFAESVILGDMARSLAESAGARAEHQSSLGDTITVWHALCLGDVDVYCEYTGTLTQEILSDENLHTDEELRAALARRGLRMSRSLGFIDNYALGMKEERAAALGIRTVSDLRAHPELKLGLSNQFIERADGWAGLKRRYGLPFETPNSLEHSLAYQGLANGTLDVIDLYTTDAQIRRYGVRVLEDDRHYFLAYDAVLLYRDDLAQRAPRVRDALLRLEGAISADTMRALNARVDIDHEPEAQVAADFLADRLNVHVAVVLDNLPRRLLRWTVQHLALVGVSLLLAILTAVPLGILAAYRPYLGQGLLAIVGAVQTLPALALLVFLLWLFEETGSKPAVVALYLYSLLPIMRNTYAGLHDIPPQVRESAEALGLSPLARLVLIELPMASRSILAGIKTAAVLNVGFATLGGLIGAGGYGQPILTGLNKNNHLLILEGAVPSMLLALLVQGLFEIVERLLVPRGLRLQPPP